jgi:two-component system, NarL family, response regulator NreC
MGIRVLIAEDHLMVRQGLRALLDREGFEVVGEAANGHEAMQSIAESDPDVVVMDISMPIMNGIDTTQELSQRAPKAKAVLLTRHDDDQYVLAALRTGARGYVLKSQAATDLAHAIRQVFRGDLYLSPGVSKIVVEAFLSKADLPRDRLTVREREVLKLISEEKTTKELAALLNISPKTAESHRTRLMQKLNIHTTAGLVRCAIRLGLVEP